MYDKLIRYSTDNEEYISHSDKPEIVHWKEYTVEMIVDYSGFRFTFKK